MGVGANRSCGSGAVMFLFCYLKSIYHNTKRKCNPVQRSSVNLSHYFAEFGTSRSYQRMKTICFTGRNVREHKFSEFYCFWPFPGSCTAKNLIKIRHLQNFYKLFIYESSCVRNWNNMSNFQIFSWAVVPIKFFLQVFFQIWFSV